MLLVSLFVVLLSIIVYLLLTLLGLGSEFPSQPFDHSIPLLNSSSVEIVASLPQPPGNIAVSRTGRIFFNFHPEYKPTVKIVELISKEKFIPFPNEEFQSKIISCLSMRIDQLDQLWLLDFADHAIFHTPKLYAIDLKSQSVTVDYSFPSDVAGFGSMLNDFNISPDNRYIYIADTSFISYTPALIVYSTLQAKSYRLLSSSIHLYGTSTFLKIPPYQIRFGPFGMKINVDSIALSRDGKALYFSPFTGTNLFCLDTRHLQEFMNCADSSSSHLRCNEIVQKQIEIVMKDKPATDGITVDGHQNVYLTAIEHNSIGVARPDPTSASDSSCQQIKLTKLVRNDELLRWPDGFSFGPGRFVYLFSFLHLC
jgi:sugar lactone lactonase YvrE